VIALLRHLAYIPEDYLGGEFYPPQATPTLAIELISKP